MKAAKHQLTPHMKHPSKGNHEKSTKATLAQENRGEEDENVTDEEILNMMPTVCDGSDTLAPCQCKEIRTNVEVVEDGGKRVMVEFPEYVCDQKENKRRAIEGLLPHADICEQLGAKRTLFRDADDQPIRVEIEYRAGCELRCVSDECDEKVTNESIENQNKQVMKAVKRQVEKLRKELKLSVF